MFQQSVMLPPAEGEWNYLSHADYGIFEGDQNGEHPGSRPSKIGLKNPKNTAENLSFGYIGWILDTRILFGGGSEG